MSINSNIVFNSDTTAIDAALGRIKGEIKSVDQRMKDQFNELRFTWSYINHLMTISFSLMQRLGKGTKLAATAQKTAATIQFVQTQVAVAHMVQMGVGFTALGQYGRAALVFGVAAAMEAQMGIILHLENEASRNQAMAEAFQLEIEAYNLE